MSKRRSYIFIRLNTQGAIAILLSCLLLAVTGNTAAAGIDIEASSLLPPHRPVPGGIAILSIPDSLTTETEMPSAYFQKNRVMVLRTPQHESRWTAVVGIPLTVKPGTQMLSMKNSTTGNTNIKFEVEETSYQEQRLTIKNKRQVNPLAQDLKRIAREKKEITAAFKSWHSSSASFATLELPLEGPISSPFGLRRFFNGEPRKPHSGLDIAAAEGTPIYAPASAQVLSTGNYFFNGNTLLLNHSNGLITMYCHMQSIAVKPGDQVQSGQIIGLVGKTGRVTGPHLHWSVSLNNARIDPNLLLNPITLQP